MKATAMAVTIQKSEYQKILSRLENLEKRHEERKIIKKPENPEEDHQQYHPHSNFKNKNFNNGGQNYFSRKNSYKNYKNRSNYNPNAVPYPQNPPNRMRNSNRFNSDGSTSTSVSQEKNVQQENDTWIPDYDKEFNRRQPGFYRKIRATVEKMVNNKKAPDSKAPIINHNYYN
ncbi:hypothetical protein KQX54_007608 [Cotesia glomerata]|uniref:Uncharacterized protein n=1 Tax=Cotesia glomerata TaxID=32391 RepID=A0AAV7IGR4_COTGL|nr:hypothetical protein KQX54_007608 [Cotesia glomerata]